MIFKIKCPKCSEEGTFSLIDPAYRGPYRCWKCKALFKVSLANGKLESCEPMESQELEQYEGAKKARYK